MNFPLFVNAVLENAQSHPDKTALINASDDTSLTYGTLHNNVLKLRCWFSTNGVSKGDKVILAAARDFSFIYGYLALHSMGAVAVPLDPRTTTERFTFVRERTQPRLIFWPDATMPGSVPPPDVSTLTYSFNKSENSSLQGTDEAVDIVFWDDAPEEVVTVPPPANYSLSSQAQADMLADIMFTSGTTGEPKGVLLTHGNLACAINNIIQFVGNTAEDIEVCPMPLSHSFGIARLRCVLYAGGTFVLEEGVTRPKHLFQSIAKYKATGLSMVGPAWSMLRKLTLGRISEFFDQLRYMELGSAPLTAQAKEELADLLPCTRVCMHYGLTEASRAAFLDFHADAEHLDTVGKAAPLCDIGIFSPEGKQLPVGEEGEICVRGGMVTKGYLDPKNNEGSFLDNGYFRTGDLGRMDAHGYVTLVGRLKEMINVGGEKVAPAEVEAVINTFPNVAASACVGKPDPILGETVSCFVVLEDAQIALDAEALRQHCTAKLESFKVPKTFTVVDALPTTATGKLQRSALRGKESAEKAVAQPTPKAEPSLRETDPALYYAERAVKAAPNTKKYREFYLELLAKRQKHQVMLESLHEALELDPLWSKGWELLSSCMDSSEIFTENFMTESFYMEVAVPSGKLGRDFRPKYVRALLQKKATSDAEKALTSALEVDPNWAAGWFYMSRVNLLMNDMTAALECVERAVALRPDKFRYRNAIVELLLQEKKYDDLWKYLFDGFAYNEKWVLGWKCFDSIKKDKILLNDIFLNHKFLKNIAIKVGKVSRSFRELYIKKYMNKKDYVHAEQELMFIVLHDSRWALGNYHLSKIMLQKKEYEAADEFLQKSVRLRPDKLIYREEYINLLQLEKNFSKVLQYIVDGLSIDVKWEYGWKYIDSLIKNNNQIDDTLLGKNFFENIALKSGKESRLFREKYIKQYIDKKEYAAAEEALTLIMENDKRWALGNYFMYQIKQYIGEKDSAVAYIEKALQLRPDKMKYREKYIERLIQEKNYTKCSDVLAKGFEYSRDWKYGWKVINSMIENNNVPEGILKQKEFYEKYGLHGGEMSKTYCSYVEKNILM